MGMKRSYEDACAGAHALDLIGERWALLVVRELLLGPKRFTDLRVGLQGISPNVLTQRLNELEQAAIIRRRKLAPPASAWIYELTDWGKELEPVIIQLGRWGVRSPIRPSNATLSVDSLILSFRTMFNPKNADGLNASYVLRLGEEHFHAEITSTHFKISRGSAENIDTIIISDHHTLASLVYGGRDLTEALHAGALKYEGDKLALERFLTLFPLPELAPVN